MDWISPSAFIVTIGVFISLAVFEIKLAKNEQKKLFQAGVFAVFGIALLSVGQIVGAEEIGNLISILFGTISLILLLKMAANLTEEKE
ncbi:MAG: hypothetical protein GXY61_06570 [Lentisphaerae bacterium]|jgi:hypothetical protein|nr:hypothetical protein [Lentisphaerota bacterium]